MTAYNCSQIIGWLVARHCLDGPQHTRRAKNHWEYFVFSAWHSAGTDGELAFYMDETPHFIPAKPNLMPAPIPHNSIRPLIVGEMVRIRPEFQDPGDDQFETIVIEAPADSPRVIIRFLIPDMPIPPTQTIEAAQLERVIDLRQFGDLPPETVIGQHLADLPRETRLWLVEKFPDQVMASGQFTPEEADLCAQLHPSIAIRRASHSLSDARIQQLADTHPFDILLHASQRLAPVELLNLAATRPGECIIILERHPESRLRYSLRALHHGLNPNVAAALTSVSQPGG